MSANKLSISGGTCATGVTCSKTDLMYGIGGQYNINQQWGVRLQYEALGKATSNASGGDMSASTISLGAVYAF